MEFQVTWDQLEGRYRDYRLQTSSQWANATWAIRDTGIPLDRDADSVALERQLSLSLHASADWFRRKDGALGEYRVTRSASHFTRGQLEFGRCDLFERLGLVT